MSRGEEERAALKTCPNCRFWQPPEALTCEMCGASFDEPVVDPLTPRWEGSSPAEPAAAAAAAAIGAEAAAAAAPARRARTPWSRTRQIAVAGTLAGVLIVALAGFTWYRDRPPEVKWTAQQTPLGLGTMKSGGTCRGFSPSADDDVAVAGRLCDIGGGRSLVVIEFNFRSRDLSQVEPRFLAESLMQGADGVQTGALDTFTPSTAPAGGGGDFTGRAIVSGVQVKTVGRIVESGNRGILLMGAASDPGDVADAFHTMASSLQLGP
jgi:hypothetical protein